MPESGLDHARARVLVVLSFVSVMVLMYYAARSRSLVGTRGFGADRMFAELRDRIALVGRVPVLPDGWKAWSCILSAHGDRFSGDFVVAHLSASGHRLEIVLVDVSGKGTRAGTARCCCPARSAGCSARSRRATSCARRTSTSSGRAGRRGSPRRCTSTSTCAPASTPSPTPGTRRRPATPPGRARWTVLDGARGPLLGRRARRVLPAPERPPRPR